MGNAVIGPQGLRTELTVPAIQGPKNTVAKNLKETITEKANGVLATAHGAEGRLQNTVSNAKGWSGEGLQAEEAVQAGLRW